MARGRCVPRLRYKRAWRPLIVLVHANAYAKLSCLITLQQSVNHVANSRSSLRHTETGRRRQENSVSVSNRGDASAGGGEEKTSALENVVTEEHQPGFKLRVRFISTDSPRSAAGGRRPSTSRNSYSGPTTTRTTMSTLSVDTSAAVQYHLADRDDELS